VSRSLKRAARPIGSALRHGVGFTRCFVLLAIVLAMAPCQRGDAQESAKVARVALLDDVSPRDVPWLAAFERRLRERGYIAGKNLVIEFRSARGDERRLPSLAAELVRLKPDVIAQVGGPEAARLLKRATSTIPVVFSAIEWDPVAHGVIASLARPATNFTGISALAIELAAKRLELLKELTPRAKRIAVVWHRPRSADQFAILHDAARRLNFSVISLEMGSPPHDLEGAFRTASAEHADAMLVLGSPAFFPERKRLAELALQHRLPTSFQRPAYAEAGGLMSYGPDVDEVMRRMADYVDRVLKGAVPAELPVEQPSKFELVVNAKTAKMLGLQIPQSLLLQANRLIE
jgi:putative tryptophan/tyrosine transport system substrate-binding protein